MIAKPIILIGPMAAGKSTVAKELAKLTGIRNVPMDRVRWYYYFKDGFTLEEELSQPSFKEVMEYWKPFEVKAVQRIISEFSDAIIDFGAGHSYFPDPNQFETVETILSPFPNIFLLLPTPDPARSLEICNERLKLRKNKPLDETEITANRAFIEHESNRKLAKHILFTDGKSAETSAREILALLQ